MKRGNCNWYSRYDRKYLIVYIAIMIVMMAIVIIPGTSASHKTYMDKVGEVLKADHGWTDENGKEVQLYNFNLNEDETFFIYHQIPQELPYGTSLCFGSRNIYTDVYINDVLVEKIPEVTHTLYNKSPGTVWHFIKVPQEDYGGTIKIQIKNVYDKNCSSINDICFTEPANFVLRYIMNNMFHIVLCAIMFVMGFVFILFDLYAYFKIRKNPDVFFLGAFSVLVSLWSFFETGVVEIFARDTRALQNLKIYILTLVPVPILYYIKHYFGMKNLKLLNLIRDFTPVVFITCTVLKVTGIADSLESIFLVHINLGITALFIINQAIRRWVKNIKNHRHDSILFYLGFITICVACAIDLVRFYIGSGETDAALFIRIGLFAAILCYGVLGLGSVVEKVKNGLEAEVISKLAYHDGLTGVANRTAYQEKVDEYEKSKHVNVGVAMFDVNNLKTINDKYGHNSGDELIIKSASIIQKSFEDAGVCYRIGGDEFVVFISSKNIEESYKICIENMKTNISHANKNTPYDISIAYGMAVYDGKKSSKISDVLKVADERMYICKAKIKKKNNV